MSDDFLETNPVPVNHSTSPEDVIKTTQQLRLKVTEKMLENGIPTDRREIRLLNEILRDMDTNALTTKKLDVEEQAVNQASVVAKNMADILSAVGHGKNPFMAPKDVREIPTDDSRLPQIAPVPGQMGQGVDVLEYSEFVGSKQG